MHGLVNSCFEFAVETPWVLQGQMEWCITLPQQAYLVVHCLVARQDLLHIQDLREMVEGQKKDSMYMHVLSKVCLNSSTSWSHCQTLHYHES